MEGEELTLFQEIGLYKGGFGWSAEVHDSIMGVYPSLIPRNSHRYDCVQLEGGGSILSRGLISGGCSAFEFILGGFL